MPGDQSRFTMRGPTVEQRAEARRAYEAGEAIKSIARRTGIDPKTLRGYRDREGWIPPPPPPGGEAREEQKAAIKARVIDFSTRKAIEHLEASGAVEQQADLIAESLAAHGKVSKRLLEYAEQMLDRGIAGKIMPGERQSEADVFSSVVTAVSKAVSASREIGGLRAGQISARPSHDDGKRRFEFATVEDEKLAEAS